MDSVRGGGGCSLLWQTFVPFHMWLAFGAGLPHGYTCGAAEQKAADELQEYLKSEGLDEETLLKEAN